VIMKQKWSYNGHYETASKQSHVLVSASHKPTLISTLLDIEERKLTLFVHCFLLNAGSSYTKTLHLPD